MMAEWMRVELSLRGRPLGAITFYDGDIDLAEITEPTDREALGRIFEEYGGKPFQYAWVGYGDLEPVQHGPKTLAWFEDILRVVLRPEGYHTRLVNKG